MSEVLIQPTIETYDRFSEFAVSSGLKFEIIDFSLPNVLNSDYQPIISEYQAKIDSSQNLMVGQHGACFDLYINSRDRLIKEVSEKRILENMRISEKLKINYTVFHSSIVPLIHHESYYENWVRQHVDFWSKTINRFRTTVLLENLWDRGPNLLLEVISMVESKRLRVCFDTGHCNVFSKVSMRDWFKKIGSFIPYIHLNDNMGDIDSELPPGEGNINWKEFNNLVGEFCDHPIIVLEVDDLDKVAKSVRFLQENKIYPYD